MEHKDLWAPCLHGDTAQAAQELLRSSPSLDSMLFILALEGELVVVADQWCRVTLSTRTVRYSVQADTPELAIAQIWHMAIEDNVLDSTQYTDEFITARSAIDKDQP